VRPSVSLTELEGPSDGRNIHQVMRATALELVLFPPTVGLPGLELVSDSVNNPPIARLARPLGSEGTDITIEQVETYPAGISEIAAQMTSLNASDADAAAINSS